ncbi:MAG TPA: DUF1854 domain-containing protein [Kofleriaceae bacterium]|nr:DUF1854 domain-containing protein [Kofleriaceae bacterium]
MIVASTHSVPDAIFCALEQRGIFEGDIVLAADTDIDDIGRYRREWLVVTDSKLLVVDAADTPKIRTALDIADLAQVRCRPAVGSGLLQARTAGRYVDLLRYSNRCAYKIEKLARKLDGLVNGEPLAVTVDELRDPRRCPRCDLLLGAHGESCPRCIRRGATLVRMIRLLRPYKRSTVIMMAFLLLGVALDLVSPQLTRYLVDNVLPGGATEAAAIARAGARAHLLDILLIVVGVLAAVQVARMGVNIVNGHLASRIGTRVTFDIRGRMVGHLEKLSVDYYDRQQVGSLVGRVAYDTAVVHGFIWQLTNGFLLQLTMAVGVWTMMFVLDPGLAVLALLPAPLVMGGTVFFWRRIYPRNFRSWDAASQQAGALSGMLTGIRVVKAFGQEPRELARFQAASARLRGARHDVDASLATWTAIAGVTFQLGGWLVWYFGGADVLGQKLSLGELMAFFGYLWMFYMPLSALPQLTGWLTQFVTQASRMFEILDAPVTVREPTAPRALPDGRCPIRFDNVLFGYDRHTPVLSGINLDIGAGEIVGVVGHSGSGKTTLINLLCRFYDPVAGSVSIGGIDLRDVAEADLRNKVGIVLQNTVLFHGSLFDNIAYGRPEAEPEAVIEAAAAASCHHVALRHTNAYDTWLGEGGAGLSGGERQRVGIARTLLRDPGVLILDEATSSIDVETAAAITRTIADSARGRTTFIITHRLSTLRLAQRIVVIDDGKIAESGTHEALCARGGLYARLVRLGGLRESRTGDDGDQEGMAARRIRWLHPGDLFACAREHGSFDVTIDGITHRGVFALRCLPVHHPERYLSLRCHEENGDRELGIIADLGDHSPEIQRLVRGALARRYLVHEVIRIRAIAQVGRHLAMRMDTHLGAVEAMVHWDRDSAERRGANGMMITDVDGNLFCVADVTALPDRDRRLLGRFIYW